ncbi:carboxymuconolactone decarboxylase family protein [Plantactinospora sp. KLBMP9567]|uniref:carboxymuconolactone decarboxylase family protein n=1 Tax=Plantactinospora sp. KLBMP9567 TaxID=3085900 RepID=UPI002982413E|nr:carboxymuconolactone decarboxylase family protein [Plantactinospora sp. KLBMP9567]MDW5324167.1 carboxymuconolactone decarboxylase family protein [Plantactinospora sp. KLBMP9567]
MSDDESRLERGDRVRREVLGDAHVDRSMKQATDFNQVVQEYVTASCWGDVWSRPGLDRRTRSLLNLAMLTALNRPHEFSVHVRGALRNGCTETEIQEVLLQTAAYCGAPAALESFRHAARVIEEVRQESAAVDGEPVGVTAA